MQLIDPADPQYLLGNVTGPGELGKWKTAAETWRLPYWDFALRRPNNRVSGRDYCSLPDFALQEMFQSSAPEASTLPSNQNPWFAYNFPGQQSGLPNMPGIPVSISLYLLVLILTVGWLSWVLTNVKREVEHSNPDCATCTGL